MIVCTKCAFQNEDSDAFCGSCAGFLEWSGQRSEPEVSEAEAPEPVAAPVDQAEPVEVPASAAPAVVGAAPSEAVAAPSVPPPPLAAPSPPAAEPPASPPPPAPEPPAAVAPAAPAARVPTEPVAVKPQAVKARPVPKQKTAPSREIQPGDKICGQCGEGNDPARKFCRRCGASLEEAAVFALPWYRRLLHRISNRKIHQAGDRPHERRSTRRLVAKVLVRLLILAVIVFVVLAIVGPYAHPIRHRFSTWYHDVIGAAHPTFNSVSLVSAAASSSAPGHPASQAIDGASNTSWAANPGPGVGQVLIIHLGSASNVDKVGFLIGDQDSSTSFVSEPRPETVKLSFNGTTPYTKVITFKNSADFQTFTVKAKKATELAITIESVYPSGQGNQVSMAEVEAFSKS